MHSFSRRRKSKQMPRAKTSFSLCEIASERLGVISARSKNERLSTSGKKNSARVHFVMYIMQFSISYPEKKTSAFSHKIGIFENSCLHFPLFSSLLCNFPISYICGFSIIIFTRRSPSFSQSSSVPKLRFAISTPKKTKKRADAKGLLLLYASFWVCSYKNQSRKFFALAFFSSGPSF